MQAYRYKDDKSDKFWAIDRAGTDCAVNHGKTGTVGKFQIKEFESPEECEKEANKLIASKLKKGYLPYAEFDPTARLYFDDDEVGPHPLTSHPAFRAHFTDELYYDCGDEEAPFGSDEGSDTLAFIEEYMRKGKPFDFAAFPQKLIETDWDMTYLPADDLSREAVARLVREDEMNLSQSDMVTYAVAFAQIKITGRVDAGLKRRALNALRRVELIDEILERIASGRPSEIIERMIADLEAFPARGVKAGAWDRKGRFAMDLPASKENLNLLYDCALEFGEHWMRPVIEWVRELLPESEAEKQAEIAAYIEGVREAVNDFIAEQYDYRSSAMRITDEEIWKWIRARYPWMSQANISHGLSQGKYYAWHG